MLRWFGGLFLLSGGLLALAAIATASIAAAALLVVPGLILLAIGVRERAGIFARIGEAILATFATLAGILKGMRGDTMAVWTPAKSR
jgi:hypothetical protein